MSLWAGSWLLNRFAISTMPASGSKAGRTRLRVTVGVYSKPNRPCPLSSISASDSSDSMK